MTINPDDPRLTAYALGELAGEEKAAFERELAEDPAAQAEVESIQSLGEQLTKDFESETSPALKDEQREEILGSAPESAAPLATKMGRPGSRLLYWITGFAAAACLMLVVLPQVQNSRSQLIWNDHVETDVIGGGAERRPAPPPLADPVCSLEDSESAAVDEKGRRTKDLASAKKVGKLYEKKACNPCSPRAVPKPFTMKTDEGMPDVGRLPSTENYGKLIDNDWRDPTVGKYRWSTFSTDVDTASYSNIRRIINRGNLPPADAVRIEEMINYFDYSYAPPAGKHPFAVHTEITECPWNRAHKLVKIGLKGKVVHKASRPACNLVFLLDVSGSMNSDNKLPLVKKALKLLTQNLGERDTVSIVVYAGAAGLVLPATSGANSQAIIEAMDKLKAGGSTAGGQGLALAYKTAKDNFIHEGVNRVILCSDGDFNVGVTGDALVKVVAEKAKEGVFLSVFGFGMGNYQDAFLENLSNKSNATYGYIDTVAEAKKLFVEQLSGTLVTIAKDVKVQVVFNDAYVGAYRLIGYANRMLRKEDFNNDKIDAGDIGAGHTVTALYEIVPPGLENKVLKLDRREKPEPAVNPDEETVPSDDLFTLKLRYKAPDGETSSLITRPVMDQCQPLENTSDDMRFAASVAAFGLLLRNSEYKGLASYELALQLARTSTGKDKHGYRKEFISIVERAKKLKK